MNIPLPHQLEGQALKLSSWKKVPHFLFSAWIRHSKTVLLGLFILAVVVSSWLWYYYLNLYHWDDGRQESYRKENFQETIFKRDDFDKALSLEQTRSATQNVGFGETRDIFFGN